MDKDNRIMIDTLLKSLRTALWFMFLTFPILAVRIDSLKNAVTVRWPAVIILGAVIFLISVLWHTAGLVKRSWFFRFDGFKQFIQRLPDQDALSPFMIRTTLGAAAVFMISLPFFASSYQTNVMINALLYVMLGLGLNIVVGLAGLLDLGYVAFYAVGAYLYALLNLHLGIGFWIALPMGAALAAFFGILLGIPVLRLKGDYLAIVTLGFGEIIRLILENWDRVFKGPSGISHISRPSLFGIGIMESSVHHAIIYMYYIVVVLVLSTFFFVSRLKHSRIGRALLALKEDEIACQAMGIDKMKTKLTAFALGATWAGMAGVIFAAKTTFINPASFTFMESAIILSIVVIGGMGSIPGVVLGAFFLVLLPEYFRELGDYRMLVFGGAMILVMVFKPRGLLENTKPTVTYVSQQTGPDTP